jgi:hypothetical protein
MIKFKNFDKKMYVFFRFLHIWIGAKGGRGLEGDRWWPNTLGLSFSNRFSHVEMRKCKNFEKK